MRQTRLIAWALLVFALAAPACVSAQQLSGLVVDQDGVGIAGARIELLGTGKRVMQRAKTDRAGRFSVDAGAAPVSWSVRAPGFQARTLPFQDPSHLIVVLYPPLISNPATGAADLAVLPYQDAGYAFALEPFSVIQGGSSVAVGDRGLSGSSNMLEDNGSTFEKIPAQYLSFAGVSHTFQSYKYSKGAAGEYTTGFDRSAPASAQAGAGSLGIQNVFGTFSGGSFGIGNSTGDLTQRSRADLISRGKIGKGNALFTFGSALFSDTSGGSVVTERETKFRLRLDEPWKSVIAKIEAQGQSTNKIKATYAQPESSIKLKLRMVKSAGANTLEYGIGAERDTGARLYDTKIYDGTGVEERAYFSDTYQWPRVTASASVTAYSLNFGGATHHVPTGVWQTTSGVGETAAVQWNIAERWLLEATGGDIIDTPSVSGQYFSDPIPVLELNRSRMAEADLRYEIPGGMSAELTEYSEHYSNLAAQTALSGTGVAVDWPFAKRWRLRTWTLALHDSSASVSTAVLQPSAGRDVAWLSYFGDAFRFDAIYRRETDSFEFGRYADADAALRITPRLSLIGTMEHHRYWSSYGASLRFDSF